MMKSNFENITDLSFVLTTRRQFSMTDKFSVIDIKATILQNFHQSLFMEDINVLSSNNTNCKRDTYGDNNKLHKSQKLPFSLKKFHYISVFNMTDLHFILTARWHLYQNKNE